MNFTYSEVFGDEFDDWFENLDQQFQVPFAAEF